MNGVKTVFLDWLEQEAVDIWKKGLDDLIQLVHYEGIWLSNNEATGACSGVTTVGTACARGDGSPKRSPRGDGSPARRGSRIPRSSSSEELSAKSGIAGSVLVARSEP